MNAFRFLDTLVSKFMNQENLASVSDQRRLRFTALVYFQSLIVGTLFFPVNYLFGGLTLSFYGSGFAATSIISLFLLSRPKYQVLSRVFFVTVANLMITGMYQHVGRGSEVHFFFGPAMSLPFLMYPKEAKKALAYSISLPMILLISNYFITVPFFEPVVPSGPGLRFYGFMSALLSISMMSYAFYFLYQINLEHEAHVVKQNSTLLQSEKMSSLGIVAAGMAHEINNPLTIIAGTTQVMRKKNNEGSLTKESTETYIERIQQTSQRIAKIVESLKVFSRNSKNDQVEKVSLLRTIEQALTLCHKKAEALSKEVSCDEKLIVETNPTELLQTLVNLISNSADALAGIENAWIKIKVIEIKDFAEIQVIDSGLGIPEEILKNLFTPFYTTKPVGLGTGLGLSISKKLMESRNGSLNYRLIDGNTAFVVSVPRMAVSANSLNEFKPTGT